MTDSYKFFINKVNVVVFVGIVGITLTVPLKALYRIGNCKGVFGVRCIR